MTSKERMLNAIMGKPTDRIPCAPDISNLVPARLANTEFYNIYYYKNPPIWKAYIDAVKFFKFDGWCLYGDMQSLTKSEITSEISKSFNADGHLIVSEVISTPKGQLTRCGLYPKDATPDDTVKMVKNFKGDIDKLKYLFPLVEQVDDTLYKQQLKLLGDDGLMSVCLPPCGFSTYFYYFNGLENLTYAYYDEPEIFQEFNDYYERYFISHLSAVLGKKPESLLIGMSGAITLQSPAIFEDISLSCLKKAVKLSHEANVPIGIHACGKSDYLLKRIVDEIPFDYIHPLEVPPMGDITLARAREIAGNKITLMGNIHTTDVMYFGKAEDVRKAALIAMLDAGINGRFILSTGDQCGRDTPNGNIFELINVCNEFGQYPLDVAKIKAELSRLG